MKIFGKNFKLIFILCGLMIICFWLAISPARSGFQIGPMEAIKSKTKDLDKEVSSHWVSIWNDNCESLYEPYWRYEESKNCALDAGISMSVISYWNSNPNQAPEKFQPKTVEFEAAEKFSLANELLGEKNGMYDGDLAWADVNRDGKLDLAFAGLDSNNKPRLVIFENLGGGDFAIAAEPFGENKGVRSAALSWGDFNNSGRLDLAVLGYDDAKDDGSERLVIFRNDGDFSFNMAGEPMGGGVGLERGDLAWVDYTNDGMMDLVATGFDGNQSRFIAFSNQTEVKDGKEDFQSGSGARDEPFGAGDGVSNYSAVAPGDFNRDGWTDLAVLGADVETHERKLVVIENQGLANNGDTWFAEVGSDSFYDLTTNPNVTGLDKGDLAWGDITYTIGLDLAVVGHSGSNNGHLYVFSYDGSNFNLEQRNNGDLAGFTESSISLGDYNNSGRVDLLVSGKDNNGDKRLVVYENEGSSFEQAFEPIKDQIAEGGIFQGDATWADFSDRGRLSFAVGGSSESTERMLLFDNYVNDIENYRPGAPDDLREKVYSDTVVLKWDAPDDDFTDATSFSYLIKMETEPDAGDIIMEGSKNTHRHYSNLLGRVHPSRSEAIVYDLSPGSYSWTVRAIDSGYKLSRWNPDGSTFEISN